MVISRYFRVINERERERENELFTSFLLIRARSFVSLAIGAPEFWLATKIFIECQKGAIRAIPTKRIKIPRLYANTFKEPAELSKLNMDLAVIA